MNPFNMKVRGEDWEVRVQIPCRYAGGEPRPSRGSATTTQQLWTSCEDTLSASRPELPVSTHRTIQGKQEDALKVIGQKTHSELEEKIFNLLDNQNFATAAVHKFGNPSHKGAVQRLAILKPYEAAKTVVAPYRAKTIRQILDQSPGGFQLENDSENEEERPNATTRWAETGGKEAEGDVSEEVRRKMADLNFKWLDREEKFVNPSEKLGGERDLLEERRLLLQQVHKRKTAKLSST